MEASRGVRPRQKECTCAVDTWATVARGRGATGEATLHGGRESAWTALQLTALHHHLLASKLTLSNTQLISSMPRHPGYDVTLDGVVELVDVAGVPESGGVSEAPVELVGRAAVRQDGDVEPGVVWEEGDEGGVVAHSRQHAGGRVDGCGGAVIWL